MIDQISKNQGFYIPFALSILFFLRKGVQYAIIGSFIPLVFILTMIMLIALIFISEKKKPIKLISRTWAIIIMIWSIIRILLSIAQLTLKSLNEYHLSNQFGFWGMALSISMLSVSILMMRKIKYI